MDDISGMRFLYEQANQSLERNILTKAIPKPYPVDVNTAVDIREDLVKACKAAKTSGHPMRQVVLAHFADRVLALAADHERLTATSMEAHKR